MPTVADHSPDSPFGCPTSWGARLFSNWDEARTHVCNLAEHHEGEHLCKCGSQTTHNDGLAAYTADGGNALPEDDPGD